MKRGALIILEGCDRCGKSTQCQKLIEELTKVNVKTHLMSFPGENTLSVSSSLLLVQNISVLNLVRVFLKKSE